MLLRIAHITLAVLVLVSSTGAPLFRHYCMQRVKNVSLFVEAASCQPNEKVCPIPSKKQHKSSIERKKCCQDRVDYLKISSDLADQFSLFPISPNVVAVLPTIPWLKVSAEPTESAIYQYDRPPPSKQAIHIWVQSFLC